MPEQHREKTPKVTPLDRDWFHEIYGVLTSLKLSQENYNNAQKLSSDDPNRITHIESAKKIFGRSMKRLSKPIEELETAAISGKIHPTEEERNTLRYLHQADAERPEDYLSDQNYMGQIDALEQYLRSLREKSLPF